MKVDCSALVRKLLRYPHPEEGAVWHCEKKRYCHGQSGGVTHMELGLLGPVEPFVTLCFVPENRVRLDLSLCHHFPFEPF
jgi:hypothetical protein